MKYKVSLATAAICVALVAATIQAGAAESQPVQAAIREYIDANMPWPPGTVRVDFLTEESDVASQNRTATFRIEPAGNSDFIGDTVFLVRFFKNGNLTRTESVKTRIEVSRNVVVTARALAAGTVLTGHDVRTIHKWVRRIHPQALTSMDEAAGKKLATPAPAGAEIFAFMLKDAPLVRKGKTVKIVFDNGPMRITTVGIPEEDGVAGNIVRVRNITSNKIIYARVLSDSLVGIEY